MHSWDLGMEFEDAILRDGLGDRPARIGMHVGLDLRSYNGTEIFFSLIIFKVKVLLVSKSI